MMEVIEMSKNVKNKNKNKHKEIAKLHIVSPHLCLMAHVWSEISIAGATWYYISVHCNKAASLYSSLRTALGGGCFGCTSETESSAL